MAESEEDLHSEDSNISDEYEDSSNMSMSTSNSSDQEEGDDVFRPMSYSSDSSSLPSSQQHWQQENKNPTLKEQIQFQNLKKQTTSLLLDWESKQLDLQQARESLHMCRVCVADLERACAHTIEDIYQANELRNISSLGLLKSKLEKYQKEMGDEKEKEMKLEQDLRDKELIVIEHELRASQCTDVQKELEETERIIKQYKQKQAMFRAQGQTRQLIEAQRVQQAQMKIRESLLRVKNEGETENDKLEKEMKLTNAAIKKRRERQSELERKTAVENENRMKTLLELKRNVEKSRDTLKAKHLLEKEKQQKVKQIEEEMKLNAVITGVNPQEMLLRKRKKELHEKELKEFDQKQKERQLSIVSKLLEEEKIKIKEDGKTSQSHSAKLENVQKPVLNTTKSKRIRSTKLRPLSGDRDKELLTEDVSVTDNDIVDSMVLPHSDSANTCILEPDIPGLWNPAKKQDKKTNSGVVKMSKMEHDILDTTLTRLKANMITKQIAAGREFKGEAFISKPAEIVFKDFEVGKVYKKKVQLTNVSYTVNHCRLVGVSEHLRDFISIIFNPPGVISAGLTCQMTVTFEPKINSDLSGSVKLLSQTGPIQIPLKCLTKKCIISVEGDQVKFGSVCVGETIKKSVVVHNNGALPTCFAVNPVTSLEQTESNSAVPVILNCDSTHTQEDEDTSHISILSAVAMQDIVEIDPNDDLLTRSTNDIQRYDGVSKSLDIIAVPVKKEDSVRESDSQEESILAENLTLEEEAKVDEVKSKANSLILSQSKEIINNCIEIKKFSDNTIQPYSSLTIELSFSPKCPGMYKTTWKLECSQSQEPIIISATGEGIAVPVYVEEEIVDMKICLTDMLYQESIVLHNRSVTPFNLTFIVPKPLSQYLEVLPQQGLIQGQSKFAAQLKLLPTESILNTDYIESDSKQLKVPIDVSIMGQAVPVSFIVKACITLSDIQLSPTSIDFGTCTVYETVVYSVDVTNKSCLPLEYGFVNIPKWIGVEPNDGFGTLLPHETVPVDIIFSPDTSKDYSAKLTCKTAINKDVHLQVQGIGILPPLSLSHTNISFAATPYETTSFAQVKVINLRLSRMDSAVIRGRAPPLGDYMFEFQVPDGLPIKISPNVGLVETGKSIEVTVSFSPIVDSELIIEEATKLMLKAKEEEEQKRKEEAALAPPDQKTGQRAPSQLSNKSSLKSNSKGIGSSTNTESGKGSSVISKEKIVVEPPKPRSELWWLAYRNILTKSENQCYQWSIPCYISDSQKALRSNDTLYLDITAPVVTPALVVMSNNGSTVVDFGSVATGDCLRKTVVLKNISASVINALPSPLNHDGTFEIRNAFRAIPANGGTHDIILQFSPITSTMFHESMKIFYKESLYLELTIKGIGAEAGITITPNERVMDWGHVMSGDKCTKTVQLTNPSKLNVHWQMTLDSSRHGKKYMSNINGQPPFNCTPFIGQLLPESDMEIVVEFNPDHPGKLFTDKLDIDINSKTIQTVELQGYVWPSNMYMLGGVTTESPIVSMEAQPSPPPAPPVILVINHSSGDATSTATFDVGCIKSSLVKKANGEFVIEPLQGTSSKCFTIDPMKSPVEAGGCRTVTVTFTAPEQSKDKHACIEANSYVNLKGDTPSRHQLLIRVLTN